MAFYKKYQLDKLSHEELNKILDEIGVTFDGTRQQKVEVILKNQVEGCEVKKDEVCEPTECEVTPITEEVAPQVSDETLNKVLEERRRRFAQVGGQQVTMSAFEREMARRRGEIVNNASSSFDEIIAQRSAKFGK